MVRVEPGQAPTLDAAAPEARPAKSNTDLPRLVKGAGTTGFASEFAWVQVCNELSSTGFNGERFFRFRCWRTVATPSDTAHHNDPCFLANCILSHEREMAETPKGIETSVSANRSISPAHKHAVGGSRSVVTRSIQVNESGKRRGSQEGKQKSQAKKMGEARPCRLR